MDWLCWQTGFIDEPASSVLPLMQKHKIQNPIKMNTESRSKRHNYREATIAQWEERVIRFADSNASKQEFADQEGVAKHVFGFWLRLLVPDLKYRCDDIWRSHVERFSSFEGSPSEFCSRFDLCSESLKHYQNRFAEESESALTTRGRNGLTRADAIAAAEQKLGRPSRIPQRVVDLLVKKQLDQKGRPDVVREWFARLKRFDERKITVDEFCRKEEVKKPTFRVWRKRLAPYLDPENPKELDFFNPVFGKEPVVLKALDSKWRQINKDYLHSRQSFTKFCKENDVSKDSLSYWRKKFKDQALAEEAELLKSKGVVEQPWEKFRSRASTTLKWLDAVRELALSELTQVDFVKGKQGINTASMLQWKRRLLPYTVADENGRHHEIDLDFPRLATAELKTKLQRQWKESLLHAPSADVADRMLLHKDVFAFYFWARELWLPIGDREIPDSLIPESLLSETSLAAMKPLPVTGPINVGSDSVSLVEEVTAESGAGKVSTEMVGTQDEPSSVNASLANRSEERSDSPVKSKSKTPVKLDDGVGPLADTREAVSAAPHVLDAAGNTGLIKPALIIRFPGGAEIHLGNDPEVIHRVLDQVLDSSSR